ncbi:hypothetical protein P9112_004272 [Eukaryota sp. TZLM1-RC]
MCPKPTEFRDIKLYTTSLSIISGKVSECAAMRMLLESLYIPFCEIDLTLFPEEVDHLKDLFGGNIDYIPVLTIDDEIIGDLSVLQDLVDEGYLWKKVKK